MASKESLRVKFLEQMAKISHGELEDKSQGIAAKFFENFAVDAQQAIHVFISIARNNEVNTFHIINRMLKDYPDKKIGIPKSDFKTLAITSYDFNHDFILKVIKLGIPEPQNGNSIPPFEFSLVLVPLLCFDKKGFRVGYGKGFYDRYLKLTNPKTIKIGLSLFDPVSSISDTDEFDIKLDYCITPEKVWRF